ncbi:MAG TPA: oxidoreductase, partial [Methylophaga sp.]|nr:oxidoreductase [Methylophaga sp.]
MQDKQTLVIGANGQIGKLLIQMMAEQKMPVKVMLRNPEQAGEFEKLGADVVIADLEADL